MITTGNDPLGEVKVTVSNGGRSIIVVGTFREGSAKKIMTILAAAPAVKELVLTSNGGRLHEANLLAREVHKKGLNTFVQGECKSACTHVLLAGKSRGASTNAKIGFHLPDFPGLNNDEQRALADEELEYYKKAGLSDPFVKHIGETPSFDMWYPSRTELIQAKVLTTDNYGKQMLVGVSAQSSDGMNPKFFNIQFLKEFERIIVKDVRVRTKESLRTQGYDKLKYEINSDSLYLNRGENKLLVVWLNQSIGFGAKKEEVTGVVVAGVVGDEFVRVICRWKSKKKMSIINGQCGTQVMEIFGNPIGS